MSREVKAVFNDGKIEVSWKSIKGATEYEVTLRDASTYYQVSKKTPHLKTSFSEITKGKEYGCIVTALDSHGHDIGRSCFSANIIAVADESDTRRSSVATTSTPVSADPSPAMDNNLHNKPDDIAIHFDDFDPFKVTLTWVTPENNQPKGYEIKIHNGTEETAETSPTSTYTFWITEFDKEYSCTVTTINEDGSKGPSYTKTFTADGSLTMPTGLKTKYSEKDPGKMLLTWKHPSIPPQKYEVEVASGVDPSSQIRVESLEEMEFELPDTCLDFGFRCTVTAMYGERKGKASTLPFETPKTTATVPKNVEAFDSGVSPFSPLLAWSKPDIECDGYEVEIFEEGMSFRKIRAYTERLFIRNLNQSKKYVFAVTSIYSRGQKIARGVTAESHVFNTPRAKEPAPTDVQLIADPRNPFELNLTWKCTSDLYKHFELTLTGNQHETKRFTAHTTRFTFKGLKPNTKYRAQVVTVFKNDTESLATSSNVEMTYSKKVLAPSNLNHVVSGRECIVKWQEPAASLKLLEFFCNIHENGVYLDQKSCGPAQNQLSFSGLRNGQTYKCNVYAKYENGEEGGATIDNIKINTKRDRKYNVKTSGTARSLTTSNYVQYGEIYCKVAWINPDLRVESQNFTRQKTSVTLFQKHQRERSSALHRLFWNVRDGWEEHTSKTLKNDISEYSFAKLSYGHDYRVEVSYTYVDIDTRESRLSIATKEFSTGNDDAPHNVMATMNRHKSGRQVDIKLDHPICDANPVKYGVRAVPENGRIKVADFKFDRPIVFKYLRKGVKYHFRVSAVYGNGAVSHESSSDEIQVPAESVYGGAALNLSKLKKANINIGQVKGPDQVNIVHNHPDSFGKAKNLEVELKHNNENGQTFDIRWKSPSFGGRQDDFRIYGYKLKITRDTVNIYEKMVQFSENLCQYEVKDLNLENGYRYDLQVTTEYEDIDQDLDCTADPAEIPVATRPCPAKLTRNEWKDGALVFWWTLSRGAELFRVEISDENGSILHQSDNFSQREYVWTPEQSSYGVRYTVKVISISKNGKENYHVSDVATLGGQLVPKKVKAETTAESEQWKQAMVTWKEPAEVDGIASYSVTTMEEDSNNAVGDPLTIKHSTECVVGNLKAGTRYKFEVKTNYEGGISSYGSLSNTVKTDPEPNQVKELEAKLTHEQPESGMQIKWKDEGSEANEYEVRISSKDNQVTQQRKTKYCSLVCDVLKSGCTYNVQVRAGNQDGFGKWSKKFEITTAQGKPGEIIIDSSNLTSKSVELRFAKAPENPSAYRMRIFRKQGGDGDDIVVYDGEISSKLEPQNQDDNINCFLMTEANQDCLVRVVGLEANTEYCMKVRACYGEDNGAEVGKIVMTVPAKAGAPSVMPHKGGENSYSSRNVIIKLDTQDGCRNHEIRVMTGDDSTEHQFSVANEVQVTYSCQHEAAQYKFQVRSQNATGKYGEWSEMTQVQLAPAPLKGVKAIRKGTGILVSWNSPVQHVTLFHVKVCYLENAEIITTKETSLQYEPTTPSTAYKFMVFAVKAVPQSKEIAGEPVCTEEVISRPNAPQQLNVKHEERMITISWEKANFPYDRCEVKTASTYSDDAALVMQVDANKYECTRHNLSMGREYKVKARYVYKDAEGFWSKWVTVTLVPESVKVADIQIEGIRLSAKWAPIEGKGIKYHAELYEVGVDSTLDSYNGTKTFWVSAEVKPGRTYYFKICAENSAGRGPVTKTDQIKSSWGRNVELKSIADETEYLSSERKPGHSHVVRLYCDNVFDSEATVETFTMHPAKPEEVIIWVNAENPKAIFVAVTDVAAVPAKRRIAVFDPTTSNPVVKEKIFETSPEQRHLKIDNLESGRQYFVGVTSIDKNGHESSIRYSSTTMTCPAPPKTVKIYRNPENPTSSVRVAIDGEEKPGLTYNITVESKGEHPKLFKFSTRQGVIDGLQDATTCQISASAVYNGLESRPVFGKSSDGELVPKLVKAEATVESDQRKQAILTLKEPGELDGVASYNVRTMEKVRKTAVGDPLTIKDATKCVVGHPKAGTRYKTEENNGRGMSGYGSLSNTGKTDLTPQTPGRPTYEILSPNEVLLKCDECDRATAYEFTVTSADGEGEPVTTSTKDPECKVEVPFSNMCVTVVSRNEDGDSQPSEQLKFRQVLTYLKQKFEKSAQDEAPSFGYLHLDAVEELIDRSIDLENLRPEPGESYMIYGSPYSGKTATCHKICASNKGKDLVLPLNLADIHSSEETDLTSFLHTFMRELEDHEMKTVFHWMQQNSPKVTFVLDDANFPSSFQADEHKALASKIAFNLIRKDRKIFPRSKIIFFTDQRSSAAVLKPTKVIKIVGLDSSNINLMGSKILGASGYDHEEFAHLGRFLRNPGFCEIIYRSLKQRSCDITSKASVLVEVLSQILSRCTDKERKRKIDGIIKSASLIAEESLTNETPQKVKTKKLSGATRRVSGNGIELSVYSKSTANIPSMDQNKSDCEGLYRTYLKAIHFAYQISVDKYKKQLSKDALDTRHMSEEIQIAAGLMNPNTAEKAEKVFRPYFPINMKMVKEKRKHLELFIANHAEKIAAQVYTTSQIALDWISCCNELGNKKLALKCTKNLKIKNDLSSHALDQSSEFIKNVPIHGWQLRLKMKSDVKPDIQIPVDTARRANRNFEAIVLQDYVATSIFGGNSKNTVYSSLHGSSQHMPTSTIPQNRDWYEDGRTSRSTSTSESSEEATVAEPQHPANMEHQQHTYNIHGTPVQKSNPRDTDLGTRIENLDKQQLGLHATTPHGMPSQLALIPESTESEADIRTTITATATETETCERPPSPHESYDEISEDRISESMDDKAAETDPRRVKNKESRAQVDRVLQETCKHRAYKTETIGPEGGSIELYGCKVNFPPGAVKKKTDVEISVDNNPKNFPKSALPISPILGCKPDRFEIPPTVHLPTWYCAKAGQKIPAMVFSTQRVGANWKKIMDITLTDQNVVQFEVAHFSDDVVAVSEENASAGVYWVINDVLVNMDTGNVVSVFFFDEKARKESSENLKKYSPALPSRLDICGETGNKVVLEAKCNIPTHIEIKPFNDGDHSFKFTENFLKQHKQLMFDYDFNPRLHVDHYKGELSIQYSVKVLSSSPETVLCTYPARIGFVWPCREQPQKPTINISATATGMEVRDAGQGSISVSDSNISVTSRTNVPINE